ncbi:MAG: preprotein translocase subunit SecG [Burkholderiales bacterium]|jgi:preprotein translocase subunit SecG|nr:preprotein translocase subunit SecG [Burkholderiales bacterium]
MSLLENFMLMLHIGVAVAICGFVLLQHGKGADMGAAFGSGASGSLFGASGSANFLSHTTAVLAAVFFLTSIGLTWYASTHSQPGALMERSVLDKGVPAPSAPAGSAAPAGTPPSGGNAPAAGTATPASGAVPSAPGAPATPGSKAGEVPK